jgi:hypothetical protein
MNHRSICDVSDLSKDDRRRCQRGNFVFKPGINDCERQRRPLRMTGLSHYGSWRGWYQFEESGVDQNGD